MGKVTILDIYVGVMNFISLAAILLLLVGIVTGMIIIPSMIFKIISIIILTMIFAWELSLFWHSWE